MRKSIFFILLVLILLVGCTTPQSPSTDTSQGRNEGVAKEKVVVTIKDFKFSPETVVVKAGTTIVWKNEDKASHTIKFSNWQSQELFQGDTVEKTFDTPGTFDYSCGIHPSMKGSVKVE